MLKTLQREDAEGVEAGAQHAQTRTVGTFSLASAVD